MYCLELVPLWDKKLFRSRPQNRILVPFRGSSPKFPTIIPVIFIWESPPPGSFRKFVEKEMG